MNSLLVVSWILLLGVPVENVVDSQGVAAAYQEPGTNHASLGLSVVDPAGEPLAGAWVSLIAEPPNDLLGRFEVARAQTSSSGRVEFEDVSALEPLALAIDHGHAWRVRHQALQLADFGHCELGALALQPNQSLNGAVALPLDWDVDHDVNVAIQLIASDGKRLAGTTSRDGWYRLEGYDLMPAKLVVTSWRQSPDYVWEAQVPVDDSSLDRRIDLALTSPSGSGPFPLETEELPARPRGAPELAESRGRITGPDGSPVSGLVVQSTGRVSPVLGRTTTDDDGCFTVRSKAPIKALRVQGPFGELTLREGEAERRDRWSATMLVPQLQGLEFQLPNISGAQPMGLAPESAALSLSWLRGGVWEPCSFELAALVPHSRCRPKALRVGLPGHASRLTELRAAEPPAFSFENDVEHALTVSNSAGPISGARVELSLVRPPRRALQEPERSMIESLSTNDRGRVSILADPTEVYVALIDANDHDPVSALLLPGESSIRLARRVHEVRIEADHDGWVRLLRAGTDQLVAMEWTTAGDPVQWRLAPGSYDVTLQHLSGEIVRQQTFDVSSRATDTLIVDLSLDRRPRVLLRLPKLPPVPKDRRGYYADLPGDPAKDHWEVRASQGFDPFVRFGFGSSVSHQPDPEPKATIEQLSDAEFEIIFPTAGRWEVHVASTRSALDFRLLHEVRLETGDRLKLEIPALDCKLRGSMRTFDADLDELSYHGNAGPRLCLLNARGTDRGWSILCYLPPRVGPASGGRFLLPHLPAGRYLTFDHLALDEAGWGGTAIELRGGQETSIEDFGDHPVGAVHFQVVTAEGEPIRAGTLRIRDRCSDSWREVVREAGSRRFATHHLPTPPSYRLTGSPVLCDVVRAGWLELEVEIDAGATHRFLRAFELDEMVTLTLPE